MKKHSDSLEQTFQKKQHVALVRYKAKEILEYVEARFYAWGNSKVLAHLMGISLLELGYEPKFVKGQIQIEDNIQEDYYWIELGLEDKNLILDINYKYLDTTEDFRLAEFPFLFSKNDLNEHVSYIKTSETHDFYDETPLNAVELAENLDFEAEIMDDWALLELYV